MIATDVPGCREIVLPDKTGIMVPVRDADALAAAIKRLLENAELRREMGKQGRLLVEAEFSSARVIRETLDLYQRLLRD